MNSVLLRAAGLTALALSLFFGCGGRNEAEYADAGADAGSALCGNGKIDPGEQCDGSHLNGANCSSATMNARPNGELACGSRCKFDTSGCRGAGAGGTGGGPGTGGRGGSGGRFPGTGGGVGTGGSIGGASCTSSAGCRNGQVCCGTRTGLGYSFACAASCGQNGLVAACHQASDCGRNQVCCGTTDQTGAGYASIACARTCTGMGKYPLCASNQECSQGTMCQTSQLLGSSFKVCR